MPDAAHRQAVASAGRQPGERRRPVAHGALAYFGVTQAGDGLQVAPVDKFSLLSVERLAVAFRGDCSGLRKGDKQKGAKLGQVIAGGLVLVRGK